MSEKLIEVLEARRMEAGGNGKPKGYQAWGTSVGVMYTSLFRFSKGEGTLGLEAIRTLARLARANDDNELTMALAEYALGVEFPSAVDN